MPSRQILKRNCFWNFFKRHLRLWMSEVLSLLLLSHLCFGFTSIKETATTPEIEDPLETNTSLSSTAETLTLDAAIQRAKVRNPTIYARKLQQESNEINFDQAWENMFIPKIGFSASMSTNYTVAQLPGSAAALAGKGALDHGMGNSAPSMQVALGQYTLYNFGKDRDNYEMAKMNVDRSRETIHETENQVIADLVQKYFTYKTKQDLYDIDKRSVDISKSVYDLIKSRVALGKATPTDLSSAEVDLLNAKNTLVGDQLNFKQALWALNLALGDPLGHEYVAKSKIDYTKFTVTLDKLLELYKDHSPALKDSKIGLEQARIGLRTAQKNALPLPTVTFSGITLGHSFGPTQSTRIRSASGGGTDGNMDVSAAISISFPILGDGGFLNMRQRRLTEIGVENAELNLRNQANNVDLNVRNLYTQIVAQEKTIENNDGLFKQANQIFENALQNLQKGSTNRLELKDAISQLRSAEENYTGAILQHYQLKVQLELAVGTKL